MPERDAEERETRTGWERGEVTICPCGKHAVVVDGRCAYCLHGVSK